jgi:hypothetical protein
MGNSLNSVVFQPGESTYTEDGNLIWLQSGNGNRIPAFHLDKKVSIRILILFSHRQNTPSYFRTEMQKIWAMSWDSSGM